MFIFLQCFNELRDEQTVAVGYFSQPTLEFVVHFVGGEYNAEKFTDSVIAEIRERVFFAAIAEYLVLHLNNWMTLPFIRRDSVIRAVCDDDEYLLICYLTREVEQKIC